MEQNASPAAFEFASLWERLAAHLIDGVIMIAIFLAFMFLFTQLGSYSPLPENAALVGTMVLAVGYRLFGDALMGGRAIGKRRMGIKVVDATTRKACAFWQGALRNVLFFIPLLNLLDLLFLLLGRQERLGDRLARTYVIRDELLGPRPQKSLY
ncbi:RDD family protein [Verrucomicrobium sp. BvORR106]|uniref:RDD family protein n=1 Tax=Verrucomicrobium sp. BvORR106 TaxID=1403819 RepID=UPI00068B4515|nr:RDD family protein [Verrucomicrobium sp. BvORR106]